MQAGLPALHRAALPPQLQRIAEEQRQELLRAGIVSSASSARSPLPSSDRVTRS